MKKWLLIFAVLFSKAVSAQTADYGYFESDEYNERYLADKRDLAHYDIYFVGELHDYVQVPEAKLAVIRFLNKNDSVSDVFMEVGQSAAYLYNWYLETGDTAFITSPTLVYAGARENKAFWRGLYEYNKTLSKKIVIHGMDFERMEFMKVLKMLKQHTNEVMQTPFLLSVDSPKITTVNYDQLGKVMDNFRDDLLQNEKVYKELYWSDFKLVQDIILNEDTYAAYGQRDATMFANINKQVQEQNINKYVVFAGLNHCNRSDKNTLYSRLVNDVNTRPGYSDSKKIVNIAMLCNTCYLSSDYDKPVEFDGPIIYKNDTALMKLIFSNVRFKGIATTIRSASKNSSLVTGFSELLLLIDDSGYRD